MLEKVSQVRLLVVGDVMLDRYWFGEVSRISPEAPVPVVKVERQEERLGGAANVARNAASLGAVTALLSVVGDDDGHAGPGIGPGAVDQDGIAIDADARSGWGGILGHGQSHGNAPRPEEDGDRQQAGEGETRVCNTAHGSSPWRSDWLNTGGRNPSRQGQARRGSRWA